MKRPSRIGSVFAVAAIVSMITVSEVTAEVLVLNTQETGNIERTCCYYGHFVECDFDIDSPTAMFSNTWGYKCDGGGGWMYPRSQERRGFLEFNNSYVINENLDVTKVELRYNVLVSSPGGPGLPAVWRMDVYVGEFYHPNLLEEGNYDGGDLAAVHEWPGNPTSVWIDLGQAGIDAVTSPSDFPFQIRFQDSSDIGVPGSEDPDVEPPHMSPGIWICHMRSAQLRIIYNDNAFGKNGDAEEREDRATWGAVKSLYR